MGIEKWDAEDTSYSDEYDRETVELCRKHVARTRPESRNKELSLLYEDLSLYFLRGERYANKAKEINSHRKFLQENYRKLDEAQPKFKVLCLTCRSHMDVVDKIPYGHGKDEQIRFLFECGKCRTLRCFFENRTEYRPASPSCDKCGAKFEKKSIREGNKIITSFACRDCGHSKDEIFDLDKIADKPKPKIDENFLEDRKRFCMTEEEGREYIDVRETNRRSEESKENKISRDVAIKEARKKINILSIAQAQELLTSNFANNGLKDLAFGKPQIYRGTIMLPYTAQDTLSGRDMKKAPNEIHRLIEKTLENTNWRPTSEKVTYNLGLLSGRIRGAEKESALRELALKNSAHRIGQPR